jgi:Fic-DOC domain mobile mystery protein B
MRELIPAYIAYRRELNEAEQENIARAQDWALNRRRDPLREKFVQELHRRMLGDVWRWAGKFRTSERNLGIALYEIPVALRQLLDDTKAWIEYKTYPPDEIAVRFHHRLVQIHPFPNGNGRHARLMADLLVMRLGGERFPGEARICRMPARCASVISPPCKPPTIMTLVRCWPSCAHRFPCRCCSPPSSSVALSRSRLSITAAVHSSRSNVIGFTDSARRAGIHVASSPSNAMARTTPARTSGSRGVA